MRLKKEVLDRLLLAKTILSRVRTESSRQPNAHLVAIRLLAAHDAADLVLAAIVDQQGAMPTGGSAPSMTNPKPLESLYGLGIARVEFVKLDEVEIVCIPRLRPGSWSELRDDLQSLPEIPFEPDQP